jgi:hypothetical protein
MTEPATAQRCLELPGANVAEHAGVGHLDMLHPSSGAVLGQHRAEALDVWQPLHSAPLPFTLAGQARRASQTGRGGAAGPRRPGPANSWSVLRASAFHRALLADAGSFACLA